MRSQACIPIETGEEYFLSPEGQKRGIDESRVVWQWEVNIDTTPAQKMTGPGRRLVVQGNARLSTWQRCNSNTIPSLRAPGHCHHFYSDPR